MKRTITVPVEVTIYEPEHNEKGEKTSSTIFLLIGGGTWDASAYGGPPDFPFGISGPALATYLPDSCAVSVNVLEIIRVGLEAIGKTEAVEQK